MGPVGGILAAMVLVGAPIVVLILAITFIIALIGGAARAYRRGTNIALIIHTCPLAAIALAGAFNFLWYKSRYVDPLPLVVSATQPALPKRWVSYGRFGEFPGILGSRGFDVVRQASGDPVTAERPYVLEERIEGYFDGPEVTDFIVVDPSGNRQLVARCEVLAIKSWWPLNLINFGYQYANERRHRRYGECARAVYRVAKPFNPFVWVS